MEEIELKKVIKILHKRWWIIHSFIVCAVVLGIIYSLVIVKPTYKSDTSIYICKDIQSGAIPISYNDVLLNDRLVNDYRELVKSRLIATEVIKEMNLKDITYSQLSKKLNATSKADTRIIVISATDTNPEFTKNLADKVAEVFQKKAVEIMRVENVQIIDRAIIPETPVKPQKAINISLSFLIGLLLGLFTVLLMEFFDDTIKTCEDIKKCLDLPVIGSIPVIPEKG